MNRQNRPITPIEDTPQTVVKGDTWQWGVEVRFDSKDTSATVQDITAVDVTIKTSKNAQQYILHHDLNDGGVESSITDDVAFFTIRFAPEEMEQLTLGGEYYYDCQITYGEDNDIKTVVRGKLNVSYEITTPGQTPEVES